jgi:hypothetical protein
MKDKPKVKKALLTVKQKQFCREYVKLKDDQIKAVSQVYDCKDRKSASEIARDLMRDARINCYIEYIRQEIEIGIPNTMAWLIQKGVESVELAIRKEQPAAAAKCLEVLDKMRGTGRRHHSFNIGHYDNMRDKLDVIYNALTNGEIGTDQFVALTQSVKSVETEQLVEEVEKMKENFKQEEKT